MSAFNPLIYNGQDIWLNDLPFNYTDDDGNVWVINDIDGWWGLPDVEAEEDARPYTQDGSYFTLGRYPGRNITVTGSIIPRRTTDPDHDAGAASRDLLNTRLNMVRSLGLFRVNEAPDKLAVVQLIGRPLTKFEKSNNVLKFNFQLRASDPRKYSVDESLATSSLSEPTAGRVYPRTYTYTYANLSSGDDFVVVNEGTYNTGGVVTIRGPVTNPYVEHVTQGKVLRLNTTLGLSDYITVDLNDRKIVLNSTASRKNVLDTRSEWFSIDPGTNILRYRGTQQIPANAGAPQIDNLFTNPAPNGSGGWVSAQFSGSDDYTVWRDSTVVRRVGSSVVAVSGNSSSSYFSGTTTMGAIRSVGHPVSAFNVTPDTEYTYSLWARADDPGFTSAALDIDFYDNNLTYISTMTENIAVTAVGGNWARLGTTLLSPSDATYANFRASVDSPVLAGTSGIIVRFADALLTTGNTLYDYFDGSFAGTIWNGAPNQSTSTQYEVPAVPQSVVEFRYRSAWIE